MLVAPEIGNASLQMLSALPINRSRLWRTKIGMGLAIMSSCILITSLITLLLTWIGPQFHLVSNVRPVDQSEYKIISETALSTLFLFSIGAVVTMLTDRTISSLMSGIVISVILYLIAIYVSSQIDLYGYLYAVEDHKAFWWDPVKLDIYVMAAITILMITASHHIFVHGETLKTAKRFWLALPFFAPIGLIAICAFISSWFVKV
jgi:hypothetical protein